MSGRSLGAKLFAYISPTSRAVWGLRNCTIQICFRKHSCKRGLAEDVGLVHNFCKPLCMRVYVCSCEHHPAYRPASLARVPRYVCKLLIAVPGERVLWTWLRFHLMPTFHTEPLLQLLGSCWRWFDSPRCEMHFWRNHVWLVHAHPTLVSLLQETRQRSGTWKRPH